MVNGNCPLPSKFVFMYRLGRAGKLRKFQYSTVEGRLGYFQCIEGDAHHHKSLQTTGEGK